MRRHIGNIHSADGWINLYFEVSCCILSNKKGTTFFRDVKHEKLVLNYKIKKIYVPVLRILTYGKIFLFLFVRGSNKLCRNVSLFINLHALHYFYKIVYTQIKC